MRAASFVFPDAPPFKEPRTVNTNPGARFSRPRRTPSGLVCLAFFCVFCVFCVAAFAANAPRRDAQQGEAEALAANARAALERMPPESRLETIGDARLRRAAQATYRAVAELAEGRDAGAAPTLYAKFTRAYSTFEAEAARRGHATCALNCKAYDEAACQKDCKSSSRKLCGCKLITFGCVVAECIF
jgi:hypothetical protein